MKLLYTISPEYLPAIIKESSEFSFLIQGYTDWKDANDGLSKRNIIDILGFFYFSESRFDIKKITAFIKKVDMFANPGMVFLIAVKGYDFNTVKAKLKTKNLKIKVFNKWELVTDIVLKECFSCFLFNNFSPYEGTDIGDKSVPCYYVEPENYKTKTLKYNRLFDSEFLQLITPVKMADTLKDTCMFDKVLCKHMGLMDDYFYIRRTYIEAHFGINSNFKDVRPKVDRVLGGNKILAQAILKRFEGVYNEARKI